MSRVLHTADLSRVARQFRLIVLLDAAERVGLVPLDVSALHASAYLADVLAPVWNLPIVDEQVLKQPDLYFPLLQMDLDRLVGRGVVVPYSLRYVQQPAGWRLSAKYRLHHRLADPILKAAESLSMMAAELSFVREVVYAMSGLGIDGMQDLASVDATYSDPLVGEGGLLELAPDTGVNGSAAVANRFGALLGTASPASNAEMINLYVRQLYTRIQSA